MKKAILILLVSVLCGTFFTGCPHETQPEQETDKYPREIIFDKEELDNHYKAWESRKIKNYQFRQEFLYQYTGLEATRVIVVRNGIVESVKYYNMDGSDLNLDDPELGINANFIEKLKSGVRTIDDLYNYLSGWYESSKNKDLKSERIVKYGMVISYDSVNHFPLSYEIIIKTEDQYDDDLNHTWSYDDSGVNTGWKKKIFDFKILD